MVVLHKAVSNAEGEEFRLVMTLQEETSSIAEDGGLNQADTGKRGLATLKGLAGLEDRAHGSIVWRTGPAPRAGPG